MNKVYLGKIKYGRAEALYLEPFEWECGWYWGGGYLSTKTSFTHFYGCFLDVPDRRGHPLGPFITPWDPKPEYPHHVVQNGCSLWEDVTVFLDDVPEHIQKNWWRIKDLFKQFYRLRDAAEVFQYGGRCTTKGRTAGEIDKEMADKINGHIRAVVIPEIEKALQAGAG